MVGREVLVGNVLVVLVVLVVEVLEVEVVVLEAVGVLSEGEKCYWRCKGKLFVIVQVVEVLLVV